MGHQIYFSAGLQFHIASYQAILAKYDFFSYSKLMDFQAFLPPERQQDFQRQLDEGKLVAKVTLQDMVNAAYTASRSLASGLILCQDSWLQSSGFPKEVQTTLENLPFDNHKFRNKTDESFHSLKDSSTTLCHIPARTTSTHHILLNIVYIPNYLATLLLLLLLLPRCLKVPSSSPFASFSKTHEPPPSPLATPRVVFGGRLGLITRNWGKITTNGWVLDIVYQGYLI